MEENKEKEQDTTLNQDASTGAVKEGNTEASQVAIDQLKADMEKKMQSEIDRRVTKLVKEKDKLQTQLEEIKKEKMSEAERTKYEMEKWTKEKEAAKLEAENFRLEMVKMKLVNELELPSDLTQFINANTTEGLFEQINNLKTSYNDSITKAVESQVKGVLSQSSVPAGIADNGAVAYRPGMSVDEINANWEKPGFQDSLQNIQRS